VHLLQSVLQHWAINFVEQPLVDPDDQVRRNSQETSIEGGVMNLAKGHSVGHHWIAVIIRIPDDVSSIEKLRMPEPTDCATGPVA